MDTELLLRLIGVLVGGQLVCVRVVAAASRRLGHLAFAARPRTLPISLADSDVPRAQPHRRVSDPAGAVQEEAVACRV
jgi:hypothetical protein